MSTSCQIEFKEEEGKKRILIYKHSDGWPKAMIPELKEFFKWNGGRNNDLEYAAANYIYWGKQETRTRNLDTESAQGKNFTTTQTISIE